MNIYDIILLAVLAVCVLLALYFTFRKKKSGCCSCGCSGGCSGGCSNCSGCSLSGKCEKNKS